MNKTRCRMATTPVAPGLLDTGFGAHAATITGQVHADASPASGARVAILLPAPSAFYKLAGRSYRKRGVRDTGIFFKIPRFLRLLNMACFVLSLRLSGREITTHRDTFSG